MSAEDRNLVRRASRGDVEAFTKLVEAHSGLVYRVSLRMLGSDDAQDASQEVWIRVWRNIRGFRGESAFSTWLYRITISAAASAWGGGGLFGCASVLLRLAPDAAAVNVTDIGGCTCRTP